MRDRIAFNKGSDPLVTQGLLSFAMKNRSLLSIGLAFPLVALLAAPNGAQVLVKDIAAGFHPADTEGAPGIVTEWNGIGYFAAFGAGGRELWRSDGTESGTWQVADIAADAGSDPMEMTPFGSELYFSAFTPGAGRELWKTDGTAAGTVLVADVEAGPGGSEPAGLFVWNGSLYFSARTVAFGRELWRTDGAPGGTELVADIELGPGDSDPGQFGGHAGLLYFAAERSDLGRELWSTGGTRASTHLVEDLVPGPIGSTPKELVSALGSLFFAANGRVWVSDGTAAGTQTVTFTTSGGTQPSELTPYGSHILYAATSPGFGRELMRTDGTELGTEVVADLAALSASSNPVHLTQHAGLVYFWTGTEPGARNLWSTDGTTAGTLHVSLLEVSSNVREMVGFGSELVFSTEAVLGGPAGQLWASDGLSANEFVRHFFSGPPVNLSAGAQRVWFTSEEPTFFPPETDGSELWSTDATFAGTVPVADIDTPGSPIGSAPSMLTRVGNRLFFVADDGPNGQELWVSDGTEAGTQLAAEIALGPADASLTKMTPFGDRLLFVEQGNPVDTLWVADGNPANAVQLGAFESDIGDVLTVGTWALVQAGTDYWATDGSQAGTVSLASVLPDVSSATPVAMNGNAYTAASNGLWRSDGSLGGTELVMQFDELGGPVRSDNALFFVATTGSTTELWTSDGTAAGTEVVPGIDPSPFTMLGSPLPITPFKGGVLVVAATAATGTELWFSDGTAAGTAIIADATPGPDGSVSNVSVLGDDIAIFRVGVNLFTEHEYWRTDGTAAGTYALAANPPLSTTHVLTAGGNAYFYDIGLFSSGDGLWVVDGETSTLLPGVDPNQPTGPGVEITMGAAGTGEVIVFREASDTLGSEPWYSDGTLAGTQMLADMVPGANSSYPSEFTQVGNALFFAAYIDDVGRELFSVPLPDVGAYVAEPFGFGTPGTNGIAPTLDLTGTPTLGSGIQVELEHALPSVIAVRMLSNASDHIDLGGGAILYPALPLGFSGVVTDTEGKAQLSTTLSSSPNLIGVTLTLQFLCSDPGGPVLGVGSFSNGLEIVIGP